MLPLPQIHKPPPPDNCGPCTACCIIPGVPELGKPFYARCVHLAVAPAQGCSIYDDRPDRCRRYRCAWHLSILGPRTDRRPDQCGVLFQFDTAEDGRWILGLYELVPGAADTDKARFLRDIILTSKQTRHLPMSNPPVRIYPFGSEIPIPYPVSDRFPTPPPQTDATFRLEGQTLVFTSHRRGILNPSPAAIAPAEQKTPAP